MRLRENQMSACVCGYQGQKRDDLHFFAALSTLPHVQLCFRSPDTSPGSPRIRLRLRMYLYPLGCCRSLSCSGIGAQWLATAPTSHLTQISDADMRTDIRFRLGKETFGGTVCPHVTAEGRECGEECDPEGYHLLSCSPGGGYFVGHDGVCATVSNLTAGSDGIPGAIADWKPQVSVWPRATRGAEADVGFYRLLGSRDTYVDAVCSLANPETYPSCERKAG